MRVDDVCDRPEVSLVGLIVLLVVCFAAAGNASDAFEAGFQPFGFNFTV